MFFVTTPMICVDPIIHHDDYGHIQTARLAPPLSIFSGVTVMELSSCWIPGPPSTQATQCLRQAELWSNRSGLARSSSNQPTALCQDLGVEPPSDRTLPLWPCHLCVRGRPHSGPIRPSESSMIGDLFPLIDLPRLVQTPTTLQSTEGVRIDC